MTNDAEFRKVLDTLLNSANPMERANAAKTLGDYVDDLSDTEYEQAKTALNRAMTDSDPMVLMAAMSAMPKYTRLSGQGFEIHGDAREDIAPEKASGCSVCGRPEALVPEGGCDRDDCPYN